MYYMIALDIAMWLAYIAMIYILPYLQKWIRWSHYNIERSHVVQVILLALITWQISIFIPDPALSNRRLHAVGWWVVIAYAYYLAAKDSHSNMKILQYIMIGMMICNTAWIANELAESVLQNFTSIIFAPSIEDTRRDLRANMVGSTIMICVTARYSKKP